MHLDPTAAAAGVRLIFRETAESTNAEALALARGGLRGPLWFVARAQTAGRGRRGRTWVSGPGNLHATLLLTDIEAGAATAQLSFVAALAVLDAVSELTPQFAAQIRLKWPNDVLCGGRKFCGILLEGESTAAGVTTVAAGIGVNCAHHPAGMEYPATDLVAAGAEISCESLFPVLSRTMLARLRQWQQGAGFASVRADWLARADGIGWTIGVRLSDREIQGVFEALDERGHLLLRLPDGSLEAIAAGDVFPLQLVPAEHS